MKSLSIFTTCLILLLIISCSSSSSLSPSASTFLECFSQQSNNYSHISSNVYTPINSSYNSILQSSIQNLRFASYSTLNPPVIITPEDVSQIPAVIYCAKKCGLQIRTRSGGHDFEGLSYTSKLPFVIIDMINMSDITVNVGAKTAWVGVGATIGSLYYKIAEKSHVLGFPAGICPTVGTGGHFSGGGVGSLIRKYGVSADNVIDAVMVDANGKILDRKSMGEDLFWAIRGGGAASFGVIAAWKVKLVDVPERVAVFRIDRTLEQNAAQLIHRWQYIAPKLSKDMYIDVVITRVSSSQSSNNMTINASFYALLLGGIERMFSLMRGSFPELGLVREDCKEVRWLQSVMYEAGYPIDFSPQVLLNRSNNIYKGYFKAKSDYVQTPMPKSGLEGIWRRLYEAEGAGSVIQMVPYGGRMAEICETDIAFPHRAGNLYEIVHLVNWNEEGNQESDKYLSWMRRLESYLTPYVSKDPRAAYVNARDLDFGVNGDNKGGTSYAEASIWGKRYFKNNFNRLVRVKTAVDPGNFFRNEQSIPTRKTN